MMHKWEELRALWVMQVNEKSKKRGEVKISTQLNWMELNDMLVIGLGPDRMASGLNCSPPISDPRNRMFPQASSIKNKMKL